MKSGSQKPPGTLWAQPGLLQESFTFTVIEKMYGEYINIKSAIMKVNNSKIDERITLQVLQITKY